MPKYAIRAQLVPTSFHQELVKAMTSAGFTRMYQFMATTDRDAYHVPVMYAQETTHFFYLPDRGFVIQLALSESIDKKNRYDSGWSAASYLQLDVTAMLEYEVYYICPQHRGPRFFMDECEPLGHVMGNVIELMKPFWTYGSCRLDHEQGSYGWSLHYSGEDPLTINELVTLADGLRTHFGPFLRPTLSHTFNAYKFANEYAWPGIRERFWRSFPTNLLKALVPGRILGRESVRTAAR